MLRVRFANQEAGRFQSTENDIHGLGGDVPVPREFGIRQAMRLLKHDKHGELRRRDADRFESTIERETVDALDAIELRREWETVLEGDRRSSLLECQRS